MWSPSLEASRLGDHNGFQYVVDIDDSDEDISIVQSGEEQIPIGSKVTISIGANTRIIETENIKISGNSKISSNN